MLVSQLCSPSVGVDCRDELEGEHLKRTAVLLGFPWIAAGGG